MQDACTRRTQAETKHASAKSECVAVCDRGMRFFAKEEAGDSGSERTTLIDGSSLFIDATDNLDQHFHMSTWILIIQTRYLRHAGSQPFPVFRTRKNCKNVRGALGNNRRIPDNRCPSIHPPIHPYLLAISFALSLCCFCLCDLRTGRWWLLWIICNGPGYTDTKHWITSTVKISQPLAKMLDNNVWCPVTCFPSLPPWAWAWAWTVIAALAHLFLILCGEKINSKYKNTERTGRKGKGPAQGSKVWRKSYGQVGVRGQLIAISSNETVKMALLTQSPFDNDAQDVNKKTRLEQRVGFPWRTPLFYPASIVSMQCFVFRHLICLCFCLSTNTCIHISFFVVPFSFKPTLHMGSQGRVILWAWQFS